MTRMSKNTRRPPSPEAMLSRMASLCARSEQCEADIAAKLHKAGLSRDDADSIMRRLRDDRFLDNRRFARAFASDKSRFAGWGRVRIRMALAMKRIPSDIVAEALDNIDDEEYMKVMRRTARAKARTLDISLRDDRTKLYRHLLSRGYESALAVKVIKELLSSDS